MRSSRRSVRSKAAQSLSERGLFELVNRRTDLSTREIFVAFRDLISADLEWADSRKDRFRKRASFVRVLSLFLTAVSTVVLGLESIPNRSAIALPLVAFVTLLGGIEAYNSWRPRWVLMEEAQYRFNRIRDEIDLYLVVTSDADLDRKQLRTFFADQQSAWSDISQQWVAFRNIDRPSEPSAP